MSQCYQSGDFKKYFDENMNALGLAVPSGFFETSEKAIATSVLLLTAIKQLGKGATIAEIAGATVALEKLAVLGAMSAVGYVGAVIGSIAVASGRALGCGSRISDLFVFTHQNNLQFDGFATFYARNPQILDKSHSFRRSFGIRVVNSPSSFEYA